jgi:hypothetical protein
LNRIPISSFYWNMISGKRFAFVPGENRFHPRIKSEGMLFRIMR